jgi:hypothetical protein
MALRTLLQTSAVFVTTASIAYAQGLDFSSVSYSSVAGARDAVAVDVNRDGWPDIATANAGSNVIGVLMNRGDGSGFGGVRTIPVGAGPFDIDAGDLNRDGVPDLVVTTPDAGAIEVLLLGADGQPASRMVVAPGSQAWGATLADMTRDGILDLVYTDYSRNRVVVLPGTGTGGFGAGAEWAVGARPQGVAAADVNHDGLLDLVVATTATTSLDVLYGTATGGLTRRTVAAGRPLNVLSLVDLNGDGWLDVAAVATSTNVVALFRGSAAGFAVAGTRSVGSTPRSIAVGDFNQDGRPDLAVGNGGSGTAALLLGRRDGSVLPDVWGTLPSGAGARAVAIADFSHDGRLDLAVGPQGAGQLWVHENVTPFVAPALSFRREPTGVGFALEAIADFNENGRPDVVSERGLLLDDGTFVPVNMDDSATAEMGLNAGDYNRDGHQDAIIAKALYDQGRPVAAVLELYAGDGRGGLVLARTIYGLPSGTGGIRTADLNRDGWLDVAAFGSDGVAVVLSAGSTPTVQIAIYSVGLNGLQLGDVTRDGILDAVVLTDQYTVYRGTGTGGFDAGVPIAGFSAVDFALGDMNHDGRLDIVSDGGSVVGVILAAEGGGWLPSREYASNIPWDTASGTILADFNNDGNPDVLSFGGAMLFGDGQGALGPPLEFAIEPNGGLAVDWNVDGLMDVVYGGGIILNERRARNRPPVADAGPDRSYTFQEHLWDDEWCERRTPSFDPDLHRLTEEWRDERGTPFRCVMPPHAPGTYTFTLTVRDGRGGVATDTMHVTIAPQPEVVIYPGIAFDVHGRWTRLDDATAAFRSRLYYPNLGGAKTAAPAANPSEYVDITFPADPTQTYKLWVRLKADANNWANDSIWLQFDGAIASDGKAYAIGTASGLAINLEECAGCGVAGWGWEDDGWGAPNRNGVTLRFREPGMRRLRIQVREDGASIDQIVLSAVKYRTMRPGTAKNDTVILPPIQ